jgi:hypothetical protein
MRPDRPLASPPPSNEGKQMLRLNSPRLAWSVAVAALALWVTSAPVSLGQAATSVQQIFDDGTQAPCLPVPDALQTVTPLFSVTPDPSAPSGTFHLCGGDQQSTAHAIEQLIAGHGFSASLASRGDGCADLTIRVAPQLSSGSASSQLNVGLGSGANLSIAIVSESGATRVSISQS